MGLDQTFLHEAADKLHQAEVSRSPIEALSTTYAGLNEHGAYAIQEINSARAIRTGKRLVGYKVGLTSREAQRHFQVFEPDFGHLFEGMVIPDGGEIPMGKLIQPKIEGEMAFVLEKDLKGPGVTLVDALNAVGYVLPSMEIVDSRIADWKIKAVDTIADNGSSAYLVLGGRKTKLDGLDLGSIGMALSKNGEVEVTGAGSAVLGNPLNAVVFLANLLGEQGKHLVAGQVILSGAMGGMIRLEPGMHYLCEMRQLGEVSVRSGREL